MENEKDSAELVERLARKIEIHVETTEECIDNFYLDKYAIDLLKQDNELLLKAAKALRSVTQSNLPETVFSDSATLYDQHLAILNGTILDETPKEKIVIAKECSELTKQEMKNYLNWVENEGWQRMEKYYWTKNIIEKVTDDQLLEEYFQFTNKNKEG